LVAIDDEMKTHPVLKELLAIETIGDLENEADATELTRLLG
jgi:hypothetical protein